VEWKIQSFGPSGGDRPAIGANGPVGKPPEPVVLCSESSSIPLAGLQVGITRPAKKKVEIRMSS